MTMNPWAARELAELRSTELEHEAADHRVLDSVRCRRCHPGVLAVRAGRALVAVGWRLGGTAALPVSVRRRLA